jgi:predicted site-specific integrase-resolvase
VKTIPLAKFGLMTVEDAAAHHGCSVRAVQKWIGDGLLSVVVIGGGKRVIHLLRTADVKAFAKPTRGRPKTT